MEFCEMDMGGGEELTRLLRQIEALNVKRASSLQ
jgi:hypothetical protein